MIKMGELGGLLPHFTLMSVCSDGYSVELPKQCPLMEEVNFATWRGNVHFTHQYERSA